MSACLKIAIVGPGRSGKDVAADWLSTYTRLRYTGSCSSVIAPHAARRLGLTVPEAFARRHEDRALWRALGDELRANDPAYLARETVRKGDLCIGIRSRVEIEATRRERLVGLVVWIDRPGLPVDPTLEFDESMADVIVQNHWGLPEFYARLERLATAFGVMKRR